MLDVGIHDGDGPTKEEYIRRSLKFGIRTDRKAAGRAEGGGCPNHAAGGLRDLSDSTG